MLSFLWAQLSTLYDLSIRPRWRHRRSRCNIRRVVALLMITTLTICRIGDKHNSRVHIYDTYERYAHLPSVSCSTRARRHSRRGMTLFSLLFDQRSTTQVLYILIFVAAPYMNTNPTLAMINAAYSRVLFPLGMCALLANTYLMVAISGEKLVITAGHFHQ